MARSFRPPKGAPRRGGRPPQGRDPRRRLQEGVERAAKPGLGRQAAELVQRAVDKLARDDPRGALDPASRARELAPRSPATREVLGIALYRSGRYREAIRELQAYRRITGRADHNHLIADCHRALGAPEKAAPLAEEAVRAPIPAEARAEAVVVGASALADLGRFTEAHALLRRYRVEEGRGVRPWDLRVRYVQADVLARDGRVDDAREAFESILRHDADAFDVRDRLAALPGGGGPPSGSPRTDAPRDGKTRAKGKGGKATARKPAARKPAARKPAPRRGSARSG